MIQRANTRQRSKDRIRKHLEGTPARPRLTVYKSLKHIYAQVIDDAAGQTVAYATDLSKELRDELKGAKLKRIQVAKKVGALIAKKALAAKVDQVVFDRNGFPYHGRIAALADAARQGGLKF